MHNTQIDIQNFKNTGPTLRAPFAPSHYSGMIKYSNLYHQTLLFNSRSNSGQLGVGLDCGMVECIGSVRICTKSVMTGNAR